MDEGRDTYWIVDADPLSAKVRAERSIAVGRGAWRTRVVATSTMTSTADAYLVTDALEAYDGQVPLFARAWDVRVPRDLS